jgi:hypothetical protein
LAFEVTKYELIRWRYNFIALIGRAIRTMSSR